MKLIQLLYYLRVPAPERAARCGQALAYQCSWV